MSQGVFKLKSGMYQYRNSREFDPKILFSGEKSVVPDLSVVTRIFVGRQNEINRLAAYVLQSIQEASFVPPRELLGPTVGIIETEDRNSAYHGALYTVTPYVSTLPENVLRKVLRRAFSAVLPALVALHKGNDFEQIFQPAPFEQKLGDSIVLSRGKGDKTTLDDEDLCSPEGRASLATLGSDWPRAVNGTLIELAKDIWRRAYLSLPSTVVDIRELREDVIAYSTLDPGNLIETVRRSLAALMPFLFLSLDRGTQERITATMSTGS